VGCFTESGYTLKCVATPNGNECEQTCTTTTDCQDATTMCSNGYCVPNYCGPGSNPANGADYYGPCNSSGTGDGTCLGFLSGQPGLCLAQGTTAVGPDANAPLPNGGCGPNEIQLGSPSGTAAGCYQLCAAGAPTGPSVVEPARATGSCVSLFADDGGYGACLETCTTNTTCTSFHAYTCQQGYCFP
jgi:hypothetical protein